MPVLARIAENDLETPAALAREITENAPNTTFKGYPVFHFDLHRPAVQEQVLKDQIEFLQKNLLAGNHKKN